MNNHANLNLKGELAHCLVKRLYGQTNKRDATKQIGQHIRRLERAQKRAETEHVNLNIDDTMEQDLDIRYQLSNSRKHPVNIYTYICENQHDPAFKGFIPKLKDHLLGRMLNRSGMPALLEYSMLPCHPFIQKLLRDRRTGWTFFGYDGLEWNQVDIATDFVMHTCPRLASLSQQ